MKHTLKDRILSERISELSRLSDAQQAQVRADEELMALIAENRVLAMQEQGGPDAPPRLAMLQAAMRDSRESVKENRMPLFERIFAGRRPLARFGLAALMIAVFSAAYLGVMTVTSSPAWSQTAGNVLEYVLPGVSSEDDVQPIVDSYVAKIKEAKAELYGDEAAEEKTVMISVSVDASSDGPDSPEVITASLVVSLMKDDPALLELIQARIAEIPGAPAATVQSAIWFHGPEGPGQGGIRFKVEDQVFNFPKTASEEEIERTIKDWLAENRPDDEWVVEITIENGTDAEGRESVRVEANIHKVGEDGEKVGAGAAAPSKR